MSHTLSPPPDDATPEDLTLDCGCSFRCRVVKGERTLVYEPCSQTCKWYSYMIEQSRAQGNVVKHVDKRRFVE